MPAKAIPINEKSIWIGGNRRANEGERDAKSLKRSCLQSEVELLVRQGQHKEMIWQRQRRPVDDQPQQGTSDRWSEQQSNGTGRRRAGLAAISCSHCPNDVGKERI